MGTMVLFRTADGQLWTFGALAMRTRREAREGWDEQTQGLFDFDFNDWLIEAINTGVITRVEVNT